MFGFGKKKESASSAAVNFASEMMEMQLGLAGQTFETVTSDLYSLGYIFGFHDGSLQAFGLGHNPEGFAALAASYTRLGGVAGAGVLRQSLDLQKDATFSKGVRAGGGEAIAFINEQTPPLGLSTYWLSR